MIPACYQKLEFQIPSEEIDTAVEICWEMSTVGLTETTAGDKTRIETFFPEAAVQINDRFLEAAATYGLNPTNVHCTVVPNDTDGWLSKWKQGFPSFAVTDTIFVHPSWKPPSAAHRVNLQLEPGHGFGSGTHESTQLALKALEEYVADSTRLIDIGTGSGILSIAASKLNPDLEVFALDIDPQAVDEARENFIRNGVLNIHLFAGTVDTVSCKADLAVANLTLGIFEQTAREILRLSPRRLILSGLTRDQEEAAFDCFRRVSPHIRKIRRWLRNDWVCLLLGHPSFASQTNK